MTSIALASLSSPYVVYRVTWPITCTWYPDNHIKEPLNILISLGSSWCFWKVSENKTLAKLPKFISTHSMSYLPSCTVMTIRSLSWGRMSTTSFSEKEMLAPDSPCYILENPRDILFVSSTYPLYFPSEEVELPPPVKPPAMVLTLKCRVFSVIFPGKMKRMIMKHVWSRLVLLGPHSGPHCTCQKVQVCGDG